MPKLITIYWRDIPAQVVGRAGRAQFRRMLAPRFQAAIDRAAMRAGRGSSNAYLEDWRREAEPIQGQVQELVESRAEALERQFSDDQLEALVKAGGRLPREAENG